MTDDDVIEGEVTTLAVRKEGATAAWTPDFAIGVDAMVARVEAKHDFYRRVMREGEHYGKIPGTGKDAKPTLLKPGAELLNASMGLFVELSDAEPPIRDYGEEHHEGIVLYRRVARIYKQTGPAETDRMKVAQAEGSCSSRETKYRYRNDKRKCPACGKEAIIKGKEEYGGGWLCFKKQGGCGAKFADDDTAITGQVVGKVPNPDLADVENTILKMADKRALVAATLLATGCSDLFTQDLDDQADTYEPEPKEAHRAPSAPPADTRAIQEPKAASETPQTPANASPAELRKARASINALLDDPRLTPWEQAEAIVSVIGPGVDLKEVKDLDALREVYKALLRARDKATNEIPL